MPFDLEAIRSQFPALSIEDSGVPRIYFDNPAGTQVPASVADAMSDCLLATNANLGGYFASSVDAGRVVDSARAAMADFLNAPSPDEIIFGNNMTPPLPTNGIKKDSHRLDFVDIYLGYFRHGGDRAGQKNHR